MHGHDGHAIRIKEKENSNTLPLQERIERYGNKQRKTEVDERSDVVHTHITHMTTEFTRKAQHKKHKSMCLCRACLISGLLRAWS